jgi:8-hydroxy-5-deazaflavin:NADPH oxidoreductase
MKLQWQVKEAFMPVAIIGAGAVGATLGQAWLKHGQDVIWGVRNPADPKYAALAKERVKAPAEAVKEAEIVVIATPWSTTQAAVKSLGSLAGKIVIDCTNPLGMGPDELQLVLGFDTSAGEQVASWAPDAFVFKTLNTTGAGNMAKAAEYPVKPLMLVAGDDAARRPLVMELVGMLGFEPVDAGPLKNARLLEPFAMVWIDQAMKRGRGRDFAFALVKMK